MKIQSKLPDVGVTIFAVMTQLALENNATNLSQGFPDFDTDPQLKELVWQYMQAGHNQYAPMQGIPALREKIAAKTAALYGRDYDPATEITVTAGATEGLFAALTAVVGPGDEVIIIEPAYDAYAPVIELNGGRPVYVKMTFPGYRVDWAKVKEALTPRTRMIVINSPHNPTGAIFTAEDMQALADLVDGTDISILSDEVYEHIVFDGQRHESIARYPELAARSFVISSFGKTYHATGWKVGYCLAPAALTREFQKIHQFLTFAVNTPVQFAYAKYLENQAAYLDLPAFYQKKRDLFLALIEGSRFKALPCAGTYFQMLDYTDISAAPDVEFARTLTVEHKVAAIPPSVFYHDHSDERVLRFCFAKTDETLQEAAEKLCRI